MKQNRRFLLLLALLSLATFAAAQHHLQREIKEGQTHAFVPKKTLEVSDARGQAPGIMAWQIPVVLFSLSCRVIWLSV